MAKTCKVSMKLFFGLVSECVSLSFGRAQSKVSSFPIGVDIDNIFTETRHEGNSLDSGGGISSRPSILRVLDVVCYTKIRASIVECLTTLDMIALAWITGLQSKYLAMHPDSVARTVSGSVIALCAFCPLRIPVPLHQPLVIGGINDGVLALCERNDFDRLVERLDNIVTLHGAFHKEPSFLVRLSAALLHSIPNKSPSIIEGRSIPTPLGAGMVFNLGGFLVNRRFDL